MDSQLQGKIEELRSLEMQIEALLMQKQTVQVEFNEALNALDEIRKTKDDIYKVISGIMIKADKENSIKELEEKKKIAEMRINSLEKHEKLITERAEALKNEITNSVGKKAKS